MVGEAEILDAVRRRNPPDTEFRISRTIPGFLDGDLVVVELDRGGQRLGENFYYAARFPDERRSFASMDELALWIGQRQAGPRSGRLSFLTDFRVVSAMIAIVITLTICSIILAGVISSRPDRIAIPDILSNALTTILGFYFGSQVARTRAAESGAPAFPAP
jgi:hypothetical protein